MSWYQATRHSFASRALASGAGVDEIAAAMGHSSPSITARHYLHHVRNALLSAPLRRARPRCRGAGREGAPDVDGGGTAGRHRRGDRSRQASAAGGGSCSLSSRRPRRASAGRAGATSAPSRAMGRHHNRASAPCGGKAASSAAGAGSRRGPPPRSTSRRCARRWETAPSPLPAGLRRCSRPSATSGSGCTARPCAPTLRTSSAGTVESRRSSPASPSPPSPRRRCWSSRHRCWPRTRSPTPPETSTCRKPARSSATRSPRATSRRRPRSGSAAS